MVCLPCVKLILCNGMDLGCFGVEHYPPKQVCIENTVLLASIVDSRKSLFEVPQVSKWGP